VGVLERDAACRHLKPGEVDRWTRDYFHGLGLVHLRGTVSYPETPFWEVA
jgi:hypothetical protein